MFAVGRVRLIRDHAMMSRLFTSSNTLVSTSTVKLDSSGELEWYTHQHQENPTWCWLYEAGGSLSLLIIVKSG